jgi:lysophospholipase L1-like esterase
MVVAPLEHRTEGARTRSMSRWIYLGLGIVLGIATSASGLYLKHRHETGRYGAVYEDVVQQEAIRCGQFHDAVVFIGDSNTVALAVSNVAARAENLGVNGDTVDHVLYRLHSCDLHGAKTVVLAIGTNDWAVNHYAGFADRYRTLLNAIPRKVRIVASAIPPVNEGRLSAFYDTHGMTVGIAKANAAISNLCNADPRCTFSALPPALYAGHQLAPAFDSGIGVHLNAKGQALWAHALRISLGPP